jgi:hypothetical protein
MSRAYAALLAETTAVSSLLTGQQPLQRLKVSHALLHMDSTWSPRNCELFFEKSCAILFQSVRKGKLAEKKTLSAMVRKSIYRRMTNFRTTGSVTRENCLAQGT